MFSFFSLQLSFVDIYIIKNNAFKISIKYIRNNNNNNKTNYGLDKDSDFQQNKTKNKRNQQDNNKR